jgi:hypothetical protein
MHRDGERHQRLVATFFLGMALFLPPVLLVFDRPTMLLGIPILYLYLFIAWAVLIVLGALAVRGLNWGEPAPQRERAVVREVGGAASSGSEATDD